MHARLKGLAIAAVVAAGAGVASGAFAVDKDQVIKDRQALMKEQAADMGAIKGYLDDKVDLAKATAAATDLGQTMQKIPDVFPPGTEGANPEGKYTTRPEIWSDWKGFLAVRDNGAAKAAALVDAVKGGDKAKIQLAFGDMGKNGCGACHEKFREEIKK
ncbi:MAG TPA: cytochrome c [Stellaceae bacterium]|nr:cytochrome c [Stellaceae bacterium]